MNPTSDDESAMVLSTEGPFGVLPPVEDAPTLRTCEPLDSDEAPSPS